MAQADAGVITAATVTIGQTVAAYSYFLPPLREVRQSDSNDPTMRGDVLLGQVAAGSVAMSVGVLLTWLTGSSVPTYTTLFIAVVLSVIYQYALGGKIYAER